MNKIIHIASAVTDDFIEHLSVVMLSVMENVKDRKVFFHILSENITERTKLELTKLQERYSCTLKYYDKFYNKNFDLFQRIYLMDRFDRIIYARLFLPYLLDIDKVLYLDADILVRKDISTLYDIDITDYYLAAVEDANNKKQALRIWQSSEFNYYNSGVLLMNLKKLRNDNYFEMIVQKVNENQNKYIWPDQDIINDAFRGKILDLSLSWNFYHHRYEKKGIYIPRDREEYAKILKDPAIVHYCGIVKPWMFCYQDVFLEEYYKRKQETGQEHFWFLKRIGFVV